MKIIDNSKPKRLKFKDLKEGDWFKYADGLALKVKNMFFNELTYPFLGIIVTEGSSKIYIFSDLTDVQLLDVTLDIK